MRPSSMRVGATQVPLPGGGPRRCTRRPSECIRATWASIASRARASITVGVQLCRHVHDELGHRAQEHLEQPVGHVVLHA
jgi:hypothetical protein